MDALKNVLLAFFEDEISEARSVINRVKEIPLDFRLTEDTRTVLELINHIAQIPRIDVGIYSGEFESGETTHQMELELNKETIDGVLEVLDKGILYVQNYFKDMSDDKFQEKKFRPFYEEDTQLESWAHFLPKFTAHIALHKGILWAYLKVAKADVNMFTYYGH
jgi:hypothetical protein